MTEQEWQEKVQRKAKRRAALRKHKLGLMLMHGQQMGEKLYHGRFDQVSKFDLIKAILPPMTKRTIAMQKIAQTASKPGILSKVKAFLTGWRRMVTPHAVGV